MGFSCTFFHLKVCRKMSTYPNAHENAKSGFSIFITQEIDSSLVLFQMIFEVLKSELFKFNFHFISSKILKISEFNLIILNDLRLFKSFKIFNRVAHLERIYLLTETVSEKKQMCMLVSYRDSLWP